MNRNRIVTLLILPVALGLLAGCPWSPKNGGTDPVDPIIWLPQSSPANVLANLKTAYVQRKIDEYLKLFSSDYTFVFNPADVIDPDDPTPVSWSLDEERTSTENMFGDDTVESIDLDLVAGLTERADSVAYPGSTWKMKVDNARLSVNTRTEDGEPLTYLVPGTLEVFFFREDPTRLASDGRPTFYIFRWEDQPIGGGKSPLVAASRP